MASEKKRGMWLGHPLLAPEHEHDLHLAAALNEFQDGMPRSDAEHRALEDYRREHHARAAAWHYSGMKAGHATGNMDDAKKHHALYSLHVKALGEDPMGPVPEVVRKYHGGAGTEKQPHAYRFHGHDADGFLVQPVTKSECELVDLKKSATPLEALRAAANKVAGWCDLTSYFDELAKGDVVQGPWARPAPAPAQAPVQEYNKVPMRRDPNWVPVNATCDNENCPGGNDKYADEAQPGYSLCWHCLNKSRQANGKAPYDPQEYAKKGYASPQEMNRARVERVFDQGASLVGAGPQKPKARAHLTLVKKMYDATKPDDPMVAQDREIREEQERTGANANDALLAISRRKTQAPLKKALDNLKSTLEVLTLAKTILAQVKTEK